MNTFNLSEVGARITTPRSLSSSSVGILSSRRTTVSIPDFWLSRRTAKAWATLSEVVGTNSVNVSPIIAPAVVTALFTASVIVDGLTDVVGIPGPIPVGDVVVVVEGSGIRALIVPLTESVESFGCSTDMVSFRA